MPHGASMPCYIELRRIRAISSTLVTDLTEDESTETNRILLLNPASYKPNEGLP